MPQRVIARAAPVRLGPHARAWLEHELDAVNAARIADKSEDEIRALVNQLVAERHKALDAVLKKIAAAYAEWPGRGE